MTYDQAIDISYKPWLFTVPERWEAIVELQVVRATATDPVRRRNAHEAIERLTWWGRGDE